MNTAPTAPAGLELRSAHPLAIFSCFLLLYTATWGGHYTSGDGAIKIAWARALIERGSSDIDPGPGVAYSTYGVGHTLLAVPALLFSGAVERVTGVRAEAAIYTFLFILNGAWFLHLVGRYLSGFYPRRHVWTLVALLGVATTWWPYTKLDFSEPLVATCLFWGFLLLRQERAVAGMLMAGAGALIRPDAFPLVAWLGIWECWRRQRWDRLPLVMLPLAPVVVIHMIASYARWGSPLSGAYAGEPFSTPLLVGLYGLLLSAGKSVFLFSPPLLLGVAGWGRFAARHRADAVFFAVVFVIQLAFYATWWDWSGDDSWGVRFLIPGVMLLTIPAIELVARRRLVALVAAAGVFVQLLAVLISGLEYPLFVRRHEMTRRVLFADQRNRIDIEDMRFHPRYNQIAGNLQLILVRAGWARSGPPAHEARSGTPLAATVDDAAWRTVDWDFIWLRRR